MNIAIRLGWADTVIEEITTDGQLEQLVGLVAYETTPFGEIGYGAVLMDNIPERIEVHDVQACTPSGQIDRHAGYTLSWFMDSRFGPVPILDLSAVFRRNGIQRGVLLPERTAPAAQR
jgi:hypothetical protein